MRRTFRRHIRKTLAQNVPPVLQEANFTFDKGEYGRAAELYEEIAKTADARGGLRAPLFHLQAGRSRVHAGQARLGLPSLKRGLELFAQRGQMHKLHQAGDRVVAELKARGLETEAAEVEAWLAKYSSSRATVESKATVQKPVLPTHCSSCGAPVRPDEVEWRDEVTAECAYCGSPIRSR
jgi:hypothetical protein